MKIDRLTADYRKTAANLPALRRNLKSLADSFDGFRSHATVTVHEDRAIRQITVDIAAEHRSITTGHLVGVVRHLMLAHGLNPLTSYITE